MNPAELGNKALQYITAVERNQSITKAAAELYISQSALSRYLQHLEERIGFRLFNRVGNRFLPTYEGERVLSYARRIGELELQLQRELLDISDICHGRLRLALPLLRSPYLLPSVIPPFHKQYPNVDIQIHELHSAYLEQALVDGEVDFAVLNSTAKHPNTVSEIIRHDEVVLAVPPGHPVTREEPVWRDSPYPYIDVERFRDFEFILQSEGQRTREVADLIFREKKIVPKVLLTTRSIEAAARMVIQGCGVCFMAETHIKHLSFPAEPRYYSVGIPSARVQMALAYLQNSYHPNYFQDFKEIARQYL